MWLNNVRDIADMLRDLNGISYDEDIEYVDNVT